MSTAHEALADLTAGPVALHRPIFAGIVAALRAGTVQAAARRTSTPRAEGRMGILPLFGLVSYRRGPLTALFGGTPLVEFQAQLAELLADDSINRILLLVDSPGGTIPGVPETARAIREGARIKPIIAVADPMAGSGAYWLASGASLLLALGSGEVGSIGVYVARTDISEALRKEGIHVDFIASDPRKVEDAPELPLTDDARKFLKGRVNAVFTDFLDDVALGRGVSRLQVRNDWASGRLFRANEAARTGLVDMTVRGLPEAMQVANRMATPGQAASARSAARRASIEARAVTAAQLVSRFDGAEAERTAAAARAAEIQVEIAALKRR